MALIENSDKISGGGSSTDNAVARWDGTDGTTLQDSGVIIDDSNNITGAGDINGRAGVVSVTGTNKTIALTDSNTIQECSNGSAQAITINTNANVATPLKTWITFEQHGAGTVSITGASGVTINGNTEAGGGESTVSISAQWGAVTMRKIDTNSWIAYGSI